MRASYDDLSPAQRDLVHRSIEEPNALTASDRAAIAASSECQTCISEMRRVHAELDQLAEVVRNDILAEALQGRDWWRTTILAIAAAALLAAVWWVADLDSATTSSGIAPAPFTLGGDFAVTVDANPDAFEVSWPPPARTGSEVRVSIVDVDGAELWSSILEETTARCTILRADLATRPHLVKVEHLTRSGRALRAGWVELTH